MLLPVRAQTSHQRPNALKIADFKANQPHLILGPASIFCRFIQPLEAPFFASTNNSGKFFNFEIYFSLLLVEGNLYNHHIYGLLNLWKKFYTNCGKGVE